MNNLFRSRPLIEFANLLHLQHAHLFFHMRKIIREGVGHPRGNPLLCSKKLFTALIISGASILAAETNNLSLTLLAIGSESYTNATIRKVSPTTVMVRHDGGVRSAAITNLPSKIAAHFLDTNEIAKAERLAAERQRQRDAAIRSGQLAKLRKLQEEEVMDQRDKLLVRIDDVLPSAMLGRFIEVTEITERIPPRLNSLQMSGARVSARSTYRTIETIKTPKHSVFVTNCPAGLAVGKEIEIAAWNIGTRIINGRPIEAWDCKMPTLPMDQRK